eukprot:GHRQ01025479.1.p2 GENE.GHRQ01025479.1~~GHRQ01025479.1.p2  ORF type:complete len:101 (+),score=17.70 GHRQ01025479.1:424-726(+)
MPNTWQVRTPMSSHYMEDLLQTTRAQDPEHPLLTIVGEEEQRKEGEQYVPPELGGRQLKVHQQVGDGAIQQRLQHHVWQLNQHLQAGRHSHKPVWNKHHQ